MAKAIESAKKNSLSGQRANSQLPSPSTCQQRRSLEHADTIDCMDQSEEFWSKAHEKAALLQLPQVLQFVVVPQYLMLLTCVSRILYSSK